MARPGTCTVRIVLPVIPLKVVEIVLVPTAAPVASPAVVIVATLVFEDDHVTWEVMFCVLPSEYVPVAVNCCVAPTLIVGLAGVTEIDDRVTCAL
jgi:hypothetical protein